MGARLGTLLLAIFFLMGFIFLSNIHYFNKYKIKYDMRNMFPYEYNFKSHVLDNGWGNLCLAIMTASLIAYFITISLSNQQDYLLPINIIGPIFALILFLVVMIPLTNLKTHIALIVLEIGFAILLPGSIGVAAFRVFQLKDSSNISLIVMILSCVLVVGVLILSFNPSLTLAIKMNKMVKEDGTEIAVRPKVIYLAFFEWILFFSIFVDCILAFVLMLA